MAGAGGPAATKPVETALPTTIGMLGAGADAQAYAASTIGEDALSTVGQLSSRSSHEQADTVDPASTDAVAPPPEHLKDFASAPVGLSAAGSTHNTSAAAGPSGSVTCGGASSSVLGLLESIFGPGTGRHGDHGALPNVRDHAWRLTRQPGFAPD